MSIFMPRSNNAVPNKFQSLGGIKLLNQIYIDKKINLYDKFEDDIIKVILKFPETLEILELIDDNIKKVIIKTTPWLLAARNGLVKYLIDTELYELLSKVVDDDVYENIVEDMPFGKYINELILPIVLMGHYNAILANIDNITDKTLKYVCEFFSTVEIKNKINFTYKYEGISIGNVSKDEDCLKEGDIVVYKENKILLAYKSPLYMNSGKTLIIHKNIHSFIRKYIIFNSV